MRHRFGRSLQQTVLQVRIMHEIAPLRRLTAKKVGLVLCGGGGKGAYQIGCWKALRDAGIEHFAIVSGVSVGALNAALIGMGDIDIATNIWTGLSPTAVLFNPGGYWRIRIFQVATIVVAFVKLVLVLPLALICLLPVWRISWRKVIQEAALFLSKFWYVGSIRPLSTQIQKLVSGEKLRRSGTRVFVGHSVEECYFDPYLEFFKVDDPPPVGTGMVFLDETDADHIPECKLVWLPQYTEINTLESDNEIRNTLLRSATLPLVFKQIILAGRRVTDGGIADNVPIYPVAAAGCDLIVVVYLDHLARPSVETTQSILAEHFYRCTVGSRLSADQARKLYVSFCETGFPPRPMPPFDVSRQQLIFVVPKCPLGSTFDFTGGERAIELIRQGEIDMKAALSLHGEP